MKETTTIDPQAASPEPEYKTLRLFEEGRNYKTIYTKKFQARKPWTKPNPEEIKTFIPGSVQKILVKTGQAVKAGDELVIFEAMKMRNIIRAPFDGKITAIPVKSGDRLPRGTIMLTIQQAVPDSKKKDKKKK
ncbi:MAG: acetyl-CoA carboxylase biotin carboxyl carrier protein subunit [Prevotellaceae bacterium]|jgi:biotin carboxyl carrier protein|nr:acetyl-CoA carboxylase biotin carboxyl carrier protein subunit [Prevotellaceae bacterium]